MTSGCYDDNGRCVNCKKLHPCNCEIIDDKEPTLEDCHELTATPNEDGWRTFDEGSAE